MNEFSADLNQIEIHFSKKNEYGRINHFLDFNKIIEVANAIFSNEVYVKNKEINLNLLTEKLMTIKGGGFLSLFLILSCIDNIDENKINIERILSEKEFLDTDYIPTYLITDVNRIAKKIKKLKNENNVLIGKYVDSLLKRVTYEYNIQTTNFIHLLKYANVYSWKKLLKSDYINDKYIGKNSNKTICVQLVDNLHELNNDVKNNIYIMNSIINNIKYIKKDNTENNKEYFLNILGKSIKNTLKINEKNSVDEICDILNNANKNYINRNIIQRKINKEINKIDYKEKKIENQKSIEKPENQKENVINLEKINQYKYFNEESISEIINIINYIEKSNFLGIHDYQKKYLKETLEDNIPKLIEAFNLFKQGIDNSEIDKSTEKSLEEMINKKINKIYVELKKYKKEITNNIELDIKLNSIEDDFEIDSQKIQLDLMKKKMT